MSDLLASFWPMAAAAASALVSAAWEGALLAGLVWACLKAFPRLSPGVRSAVWLSVFALLIGLQVLPLVGGGGSEEVRASAVHLDARWSYAIVGLWVLLSLGRSVQLGVSLAHLRRLAKRSVEAPADAAFDEIFDGRRVRLYSSEEIARPSVIGFFQPKILIPAKLLKSLPAAELRQVLIHEMEHLRRADDWTNLLQKVALVVFPMNPALMWVERRLCAERELACDDRVLAAGNGRKAYALCLAHLAEHTMLERGMSLALGAWERRPELVRRVERILHEPARRMERRVALGVAGGVMAASLCGAVALVQSPRMVSFGPVPQVELAASEMPKLSGEGGARLQLVKAVMPVATPPAAAKAEHAVRTRCKAKSAEPEMKLAGLRVAPPKDSSELLLMAEWNEMEMRQRVILTALQMGNAPSRAPAAMTVPAVYIVATPNGWLIVQI